MSYSRVKVFYFGSLYNWPLLCEWSPHTFLNFAKGVVHWTTLTLHDNFMTKNPQTLFKPIFFIYVYMLSLKQQQQVESPILNLSLNPQSAAADAVNTTAHHCHIWHNLPFLLKTEIKVALFFAWIVLCHLRVFLKATTQCGVILLPEKSWGHGTWLHSACVLKSVHSCQTLNLCLTHAALVFHVYMSRHKSCEIQTQVQVKDLFLLTVWSQLIHVLGLSS